ncbi:hypothetical protein C5952_17510 [Cronobacter sakazakii]|uniref:hypothetical protein n=1 Tax=Cronobacter TaxID=413496 RepID=UPI000A113481|nr:MULTISPECIES: hypothetical protein [Cronobacter]EJH4501919.1 hypothetical protein [Cronobacter sakazakii]EJV9474185.1 hypothetical protein [Cronobacter sakazakii]ELY2773089.1 hypothetical protein [Cronobacter sakazakii]ELY6202315.1 hypothetical protein [Cronobacter malonaticus]ELY6256190.1 hypothetical protein [Cronobacter malonaticus]
MGMGWFEHTDCSAEEADELISRYRLRGAKVERYLSADCRKFTVRVLLPESKHPPRQDRTFQQRVWR